MKDGKCYFIKCEGTPYVKIGKTRDNVKQRLKGIQGMCPLPLSVLAITEQYDEKQLHSMFQEYRSTGEWFRMEGKLAAFIHTLRLKDENRAFRYILNNLLWSINYDRK